MNRAKRKHLLKCVEDMGIRSLLAIGGRFDFAETRPVEQWKGMSGVQILTAMQDLISRAPWTRSYADDSEVRALANRILVSANPYHLPIIKGV